MGRGKKSWKKGGRSKDGAPPKKRVQNTQQGQRGSWKEIERENAALEAYYKTLGIIPEEEWEAFMSIQKTDLPATFRVVDSRGDSILLNNIMKDKIFAKLPKTTKEGELVPVPENLSWYPNDLAWQIGMSRPSLRHSEELLPLHQFLVSEAERGSIARQEAVSMIPPLVLDVKPHHNVLDMCAAPGSKTLQMLEALHADGPHPSGLVIANDGDNKRCYMLVTQTKRFSSPAFMITNEDATRYPNLKVFDKNNKLKVLKYDRILCDVPCTGDGTLRKNYAIWNKWGIGESLGIHKLQRRILLRGMDMLAEGGRIVYSTCSMNPLENEATVLSALKDRPGFKLVPTENLLPGLKRRTGLTTWKVMHTSGTWYEKFDDVDEKHRKSVAPTMFPDGAVDHNLHYCMRVYPHLQNTGGFFICVIEKEPSQPEPLPAESKSAEFTVPTKENEESTEEKKEPFDNRPNIHKDTNVLVDKMKWKNFHGYREDPFIFLDTDSKCFDGIKEFYNINDNFPYRNIFVRSEESKQRNLSVACSQIRDIIEQNDNNHKLKVINCGLRIFSYCKEVFSKCPYRLLQEGAHFTAKFMGEKLYTISREVMLKLVTPESCPKTNLPSELSEKLKDLPLGIIVFYLKSDGVVPDLYMCVYNTAENIRSYITEDERNHIRILLGLEPLLTKREKKKVEAMEFHRQKREATAKRIEEEKHTQENGGDNKIDEIEEKTEELKAEQTLELQDEISDGTNAEVNEATNDESNVEAKRRKLDNEESSKVMTS